MGMFKLRFLALLLFASAASAQTQTLVSGTLTDPNGVAYYPATVIACLSPSTLNPTVGGNAVNPRPGANYCVGPVNTSGSGFFSMALWPNANIAPASTTWVFTVQASGTPPPSGNGTLNFSSAGVTISGATQDVSTNINSVGTAQLKTSGVSISSSIPGQPGLTSVPVTSGLLAEYRILPTETPASLVDYSGNSRNATGTVGTTPTIIAATGGLQCNANGAVVLPAAVNGALDVFVYIGYQANYSAGGGQFGTPVFHSPIQGNGNGTTVNNSGLAITDFTVNGQFIHYGNTVWPNKSGNLTADSVQAFNGNGLLEWSMPGTQDKLYLNGTEMAYDNFVGGSSAGVNIFPFQLCGAAAGSGLGNQSYYQGQLYYVVLYNRVVNAAERAQISHYIISTMASRGVPVNMQFSTQTGDNVACVGDSMTQSFGAPTHPWCGNNASGAAFFINSPTIVNMGSPGVNSAETATADPSYLNQWFQKSAARNAAIFMMGTNDACNGGFVAATSAANLAQTLHRQKLPNGQKIILSTIPDCGSGSASAGVQALNAFIRQYWRQWGADALADIQADPNLGASGANANTVFFTDTVHNTATANINDIAPITQRAYNRLFGNNDFSNATTYSSAAAVAVATTAVTESGNTVTVTMAATPANCLVGNTAIVTGVTAGSGTATGYNATAANGTYGGWQILTRSATQITYWDNTTGLGAATVQGTVSCPQMQDADQYAIVNFGAGNYTLESCVGYTGQNIYIKNVNAASSTIVPFSAETIDGAATLTIASKATVILQSILTSPSAAGCSWKQLQNN